MLLLLMLIIEILLKLLKINIKSFIISLLRVHHIFTKQLRTFLLIQSNFLRLQEDHELEELHSQLAIDKCLLEDSPQIVQFKLF